MLLSFALAFPLRALCASGTRLARTEPGGETGARRADEVFVSGEQRYNTIGIAGKINGYHNFKFK